MVSKVQRVPRLPVQPPAGRRAALNKRRALIDNAAYSVGYGKPPKSGQFRKGESGYPKGRRKGTRNVATLLVEALNEQVVVKENGSSRRISKLEMAFRQLVDQGAAGNLRALRIILERVDAALNRTDTGHADMLEEADREVAQALIERIRAAGGMR